MRDILYYLLGVKRVSCSFQSFEHFIRFLENDVSFLFVKPCGFNVRPTFNGLVYSRFFQSDKSVLSFRDNIVMKRSKFKFWILLKAFLNCLQILISSVDRWHFLNFDNSSFVGAYRLLVDGWVVVY